MRARSLRARTAWSESWKYSLPLTTGAFNAYSTSPYKATSPKILVLPAMLMAVLASTAKDAKERMSTPPDRVTGEAVGTLVGTALGAIVGPAVVGATVGTALGVIVGSKLGADVVGSIEGAPLGAKEGPPEGSKDVNK
jgi:phage tail tape-measure protein